mmetsp:Transcript_11794/g.21799  ORF Transcript_11794/g.21799 Transcript_11794/m.21799 type:complete len:306 (+) Transcript_11794:510-1427(+)
MNLVSTSNHLLQHVVFSRVSRIIIKVCLHSIGIAGPRRQRQVPAPCGVFVIHLGDLLGVMCIGDTDASNQALSLLLAQYLFDSDFVTREDLPCLSRGGVAFESATGVVVVVPPGSRFARGAAAGGGVAIRSFVPPFFACVGRLTVSPVLTLLGLQQIFCQFSGGPAFLNQQCHFVFEVVKILPLEPYIDCFLRRKFTNAENLLELAEMNTVLLFVRCSSFLVAIFFIAGSSINIIAIHSHVIYLTLIISNNTGPFSPVPPSYCTLILLIQTNIEHAGRKGLSSRCRHAQIKLHCHGGTFYHSCRV